MNPRRLAALERRFAADADCLAAGSAHAGNVGIALNCLVCGS
jgi:hypothetical protein